MWTDMHPACGKVLFVGQTMVGPEAGENIHFCIDQLQNGDYRLTVGDLFQSITACIQPTLPELLATFQVVKFKITRQ